MKPFIVVPDGFDKSLFEQLKKCDQLEVHPTSKVSQDELKALLPRVNGLIIRSATTINEELLALAPNLKIVIRAGEGTDNIDKKACAQKGVKAANTPGANSNSAAEHAVALMMTILRKTHVADCTMKQGKWEKNRLGGNELANKKVGLVGFGKIAQLVAKRISGFEPEVIYYTRKPTASPFSYAKQAKDLKEIFSTCDIISLHTSLNADSKNMVNKELLSMMKKDAVLINASRGGIVDEEALYEVLKEGKIKGAALDVFSKEPMDPKSKFIELENVVLTPHLGASTDEAQFRVGQMCVHQIKEFFLNNNLLNEVKA